MLQVHIGPEAPPRIQQEGGTGLHVRHVQDETCHGIRSNAEIRTDMASGRRSVPWDHIP